jgi:hypothetical protein
MAGELRVRASAAQAGRLLEWAAAWPVRRSAMKNSSRRASLAVANDGVSLRRSSGLVVKVRDRYQQPREVHCVSHGDCFLPCDRMTLCVRTAGEDDPAVYRDLRTRTDCLFGVRRGLGVPRSTGSTESAGSDALAAHDWSLA